MSNVKAIPIRCQGRHIGTIEAGWIYIDMYKVSVDSQGIIPDGLRGKGPSSISLEVADANRMTRARLLKTCEEFVEEMFPGLTGITYGRVRVQDDGC